MTFGQKYNLDKVKRKMIFEKTVFYDILYLSIIQIKRDGIRKVKRSNEYEEDEYGSSCCGTPADGFLRHYQEDGRSWKGEFQRKKNPAAAELKKSKVAGKSAGKKNKKGKKK